MKTADWKHIDFIAEKGCLCGCDFSGTVMEIGPKVKKDFKVGDRVMGVAHGSNVSQLEDGAFAEIIVVKAGLMVRMPEDMSYEDAASFGVGVTTVGQAMCQSLKLPLPGKCSKKHPWLLIYGGSTATGVLAIQYAKL
jgi:NADPH:quinone reductase-like Zn-dependent oxidoreductase